MKAFRGPRLAGLALLLAACGGRDISSAPAAGSATLLQSGADLALWGVTTDGTIVYRDGTEMFSLPPGGQPAPMVPIPGTVGGGVYGDVLILVSQTSMSSLANVTVWTTAHGLETFSTSALPIQVTPSADGQYVSYFTSSDAALPTTGDLHVARTDGTGDTLLKAGVMVGNSTCESIGTFIGSYVVLSECMAGEPPSARTVTTFAAPSWTTQTIFSGGTPGRWDADTSQVLFANAAGLQVAPLGGGTPVVIDPSITTGMGVYGAFVPGGSVLYLTPGGAFERATIGPSPEPTMLISSGVNGLSGVSPDGQYAMLFQSQDGENGFTDLRLASTVTPGAPIVLASTPTNDWCSFTEDSSQVLYLTDLSPTTLVGALYSRPVDASGVPVLLSQTGVGAIRSIGPTSVLFMDNPDLSGGPAWTTSDLEWVDVAQSAPPTHIASRLQPPGGYPAPAYAYSVPLGGVVYVTALPSGGGFGLYLAQLP